MRQNFSNNDFLATHPHYSGFRILSSVSKLFSIHEKYGAPSNSTAIEPEMGQTLLRSFRGFGVVRCFSMRKGAKDNFRPVTIYPVGLTFPGKKLECSGGNVPLFSFLPFAMDRLLDLVVSLLQLIPWFAALVILTVVAWYALRLIRVHLSKTELKPANYLESFQKLRDEGQLTAEEFRIIRQLVSLQLTQSPADQQSSRVSKADYSLLNKTPPSKKMD